MVARTEFIGPAQGGEEPAKSKMSVVAVAGHGEGDGQRLVDHAVAVDEGLGPVGAVGDERRSSRASGWRRGLRISAMAASTVASP